MSSSIKAAIQTAQRCLSEYWPLQSFIATNPLWHMTDQHFLQTMQTLAPVSFTLPADFYQAQFGTTITEQDLHEAITNVLGQQDETEQQQWYHDLLHSLPPRPAMQPVLFSQQLTAYQYQSAVDWVQTQCCEVLLHFFGQPQQAHDLLTFWHLLWRNDHQAVTYSSTIDRAQQIETLLGMIGVPQAQYTCYLQHIALSLYGWGSLIKWLQAHPDNPWLSHQVDIESLLILWLHYEAILQQQTGQTYQPIVLNEADHQAQQRYCQAKLIWQQAYERPYHRQLLSKLKRQPTLSTTEAQLVFCIDVRSEGLRRHLEKQGPYSTYGFAGFFGFAFALEHQHGQQTLQYPALITPEIIVRQQAQQQAMLVAWRTTALNTVQQVKRNLFSPYVLFELLGVWLLPRLLQKTYAPTLHHSHHSHPAIKWQPDDGSGLSLAAATESAFQLLTTINLIDNFAPTVVICAHQSTSENNPFAAALDCGACGGNSGIPNAIIAAQVMNDPQVRTGLSQRGIDIPEHTQFIAACHHTTRDEVEWLTEQPPIELQQAMQAACQMLRQERQQALPSKRSVQRREHDWAELIPELGLANNAALIVGPRWLTEQVDLQRRTFLQSYDPAHDEDGSILEAIMCAPVVVAHWINSQYYMSTVAPETFGAGNKAIHNVIPGIGVMAGNLSDLKVGLPEQSVRFRDNLLHEPRRLFVVLYANPKHVDTIFAKHVMLANLRDGDWVQFHVIDATA